MASAIFLASPLSMLSWVFSKWHAFPKLLSAFQGIDWVLKLWKWLLVEEDGLDGHWPVSCIGRPWLWRRYCAVRPLTPGKCRQRPMPWQLQHSRMSGRTNESIMVNGEVVDEVDHFTYPGSKMSNRGDGEEEILVRISKASQVFASPRGTWRSKNISQKKKIGFFKSNFLSILLFGAESMKMTKTPSARSLK